MKKRILLVIMALLLAASIAVAAVTVPQEPPGKRLSADDRNEIVRRFNRYIESRGFSGAVYAVYHGKTIYDKGNKKATETLDNGSDVAYGVASLTKQFTAAAILQLYEAEKLSLDDTLDRYFPDYAHAKEITIRQLLSQRSGIPDYMVNTSGDQVIVSCVGGGKRCVTVDADSTDEENREKIRAFFFSMDLLFEPGSRFDYSDSNYALLAEIIAQVSGMSYHDYLRSHIFEPLKMRHSAFIDDYDPAVITKVAATGTKEFSLYYYTLAGVEYGCGDILTTPRDLYLWYRGLTRGKVISEASYAMMTENYSPEETIGYGFGLLISDKSDSKVLFHTGYIPAYCCTVTYIPEYDYFQAVLSNRSIGKPYHLAADMATYFGSVIDLNLVNLE